MKHSTTYLNASFRGTPVFVELSASDMYLPPETIVPVFEERGTGELIMHEAPIGDLTINGPAFGEMS